MTTTGDSVDPALVVTGRLLARRPAADDAEGYASLLLAPEVGAWLRPPPLAPLTRPEALALLAGDLEHWSEHAFGPWLLLDRVDGSLVGRGGLRWTAVASERAVELPWALVPSRWGEGLATEAALAAIAAARSLGLSEVVSLTLVENDASRRVMAKAGLRFAGRVEHGGLPHLLYRLAL